MEANSQPQPVRGAFIVIEGLDRAGKTTQTTRLVSRLQAAGKRVQHMRFPDRTSPIGQTINAYLQGKTQISDHAIHLLFSANRWEFANTITESIASGTTVIADRYIHSGMVYSAAKGNPALGLEWARMPDVGLPKPDVVVFLDLETEVARGRGAFGEEVYERVEMQRRVRGLFVRVMDGKGEGIVEVDAGRDVDEVEKDVWGCVEDVIRDVEGGKAGVKTDVVGKWVDEMLV